jgi:hypothetical protein
MPRSFRVHARAAHAALLGLAVAVCAGCGSGGTGVVTGKVTINNKPLPSGSITFLSEAGNHDAFTATIKDGEYRTGEMPVGPAKAYISPPLEMPEKGPEGGDQRPVTKAARKKGPIPHKYLVADTSGLSLTVQKGENPFNVDMVP